MAGISGLLSGSKSRTTLIFAGIVIAIAIGLITALTGGDELDEQKSKTSAIPKNIDTTPGEELPERYRDLQVADNIRRAEEAEKSGKSAIPTIVGGVKKYDFDLPDFEGETLTGAFKRVKKDQVKKAAKKKKDPKQDLQNLFKSKQRTRATQKKQVRDTRTESRRVSRLAKEQSKSLDKMASGMQSYLKPILLSWYSVTPQLLVTGSTADTTGTVQSASAGTSSREGSGSEDDNAPIVKAGTIYYATLETAVSSDEISPILATIVQGPYKGAKLVGAVTHTPGSETMILRFDVMNVPTLAESVEIEAVAIDPDTARTALASDVDHHYFVRYGALFASSFLEGYGDVISGAGSTVTTSPIFGTTTETKPTLDSTEEIYAALADVGKAWGQNISEFVNKPATVTVDQGLGFGLLFLTDAKIAAPELPATTRATEAASTTAANVTASVTEAAAPRLSPEQSAVLASAISGGVIPASLVSGNQ